MSEVYTGWFDGWQNARQRRAINELSGEISSLSSSLSRQARESSRLRSQLSQLRGTLEQRVSRLTDSLQALVELTDIRLVLAMFDPPALVRHRAREVVTDLCEADGAILDLPPMPDDVPGYWLAPAVGAFAALVRGEDAAQHLATAQERDRRRTALLLTCGLTLAGRTELAEQWLPDGFGPLLAEVPVSQAQRTLWMMAAAGRFGAAGKELLAQRLAGLVGGLTPDREQAEQRAWLERADQLPAGNARLPQLVRGDEGLARGLAAGGRLAALRVLCCPEASDPPAADEGSREHLTAVLHSLVDEGTPEEAPLLRRAAELRAIIEAGEASAPAPVQWDGDAGDPCELLRTDAFRESSPELAEVARQASRGWLVAAATRLAERAAADVPTEVTLRLAGTEIRVRQTGADSWDLTRARRGIEERPVVDPRADRTTLILAIVGGVLFLAVIGWPNGFAVVAALTGAVVLVAAAVRWYRERQNRSHRVDQQRAELTTVDKQVARATADLAEVQQLAADAEKAATADLTAIRTRLGPKGG